MIRCDFFACHFGKSPPKEPAEARDARVAQRAQFHADALELRNRRRRRQAGATANPNFGSGEGVSLGAGL